METSNRVRILVNGISAKSAGGLSILRNFVATAIESSDRFEYIIIVDKKERFSEFSSPRIQFLSAGHFSLTLMMPLAACFFVPRVMKKYRCELLFNISDVPVPIRKPQVFLFDWPYAAYLRSPAWFVASPSELIIRLFKLLFFWLFIRFPDRVIAQSRPLKERIEENFGVYYVDIVPNAVSRENLLQTADRDFLLPAGFKFLCLSKYYPHKNIEVFLPVARRIRDCGIQAKIVVTLDENGSTREREFLKQIKSEGLQQTILNVGVVSMQHVPSLYKQTDALILPTFLESFSGTYVEAMHHRKPILTSDFDFSREVCGEAAYYFSPADADQIVSKIYEVMNDSVRRDEIVKAAHLRLQSFPEWPEIYRRFLDIFEDLIEQRMAGS